MPNIETRADASYYTNYGGHPPQTDLLTDRAIVTEAYTVIPRGVLRDIVTSVFPEWTGTRAWVLNRPVAGGSTTFAQSIVEVTPGGGSQKPEPQAEVQSFIFVVAGVLTVTINGAEHKLEEGGFAYVPAGADWSVLNNGGDDRHLPLDPQALRAAGRRRSTGPRRRQREGRRAGRNAGHRGQVAHHAHA